MASDAEPAKVLLPYLQRADELQKHEPLVAYYCRLYAMERGMQIPAKDRTKTTNSILISLMNQLEKDKRTLKLAPDDNLYLEGFASNVFAKADKQDRAGRADLYSNPISPACPSTQKTSTCTHPSQVHEHQKDRKNKYTNPVATLVLSANNIWHRHPDLNNRHLPHLFLMPITMNKHRTANHCVPFNLIFFNEFFFFRNTAKTFYAASIFFEILTQFGDVQPELEQKQKYAIWKAADIRKAIKEGRMPEPGPPGGEKDMTSPSDSPSGSVDLGRSQSFTMGQQGSFDMPPPQPLDKQSLDKDLERRMSFSSNYKAAPTDHMPLNQHPPPDPTPSQHSPTPTHYTPPPYTTSSSYPSPTDAPQYPPPPPPPDPASYPQQYHQDAHYTQNSFPTDNPSTSFPYPNFQSYPSFHDNTLPSVPSHQPSFYTDPNQFQNVFAAPPPSTPATVPPVTAPPVTAPPVKNTPVAPSVPVAENYHYDSSYQPSVEKISEAHKAARFAVGALAFDDVVVAVDHLKRALDLLTNPVAKIN